jgi:hypothetical protein
MIPIEGNHMFVLEVPTAVSREKFFIQTKALNADPIIPTAGKREYTWKTAASLLTEAV